MRVRKKRPFQFYILFILLGTFTFLVNGQKTEVSKPVRLTGEESINMKGNETEAIMVKKSATLEEEPDTSFTYEKYADFLRKISDTSKYIVLPIDEFRKKIDPKKIVIGLRHDVDNDLNVARRFSQTERDLGFRSTYFILHTADYYLANSTNKAIHTDAILPILKDMQNNGKFEIGWHNDLVTLQVVYKIDPVNFLHQELAWLRNNGIKMTGTASHGSNYCKVYWYLNFYFFEECTWPIVGQYVNNVVVPTSNVNITLKKGKLSDFGLEYEAYFLNNSKYFSDASFVGSTRWSIGMLDLSTLQKGDRVIILLHPIHWHQGSAMADFRSFNIEGQVRCTINEMDTTISVVLPSTADRTRLIPTFSLSPGAYVKVSGAMQTSGNSPQNFTSQVIYNVYAENRNVIKKWKVKVESEKSAACDIESFSIPGYSKRIVIDQARKTVLIKVSSSTKLISLPVQFRISEGSTAWINSVQQFSNVGTVDFTQPVYYRIVAEDGVTSCDWKVSVEFLNNKADLLSFVVPGMAKPATIDQENKEVALEIKNGEALTDIPVLFVLSSNARAYVNDLLQISGLSINSFSKPVVYRVISEDSLVFNNWKVSATYVTLGDEIQTKPPAILRIYPNPARDKAILELLNIAVAEVRIEILNSLGKSIYSSHVGNTSYYSEELDLSGYSPGLYFVRCSTIRDPVPLIIARH